jgi:hypothetical protein
MNVVCNTCEYFLPGNLIVPKQKSHGKSYITKYGMHAKYNATQIPHCMLWQHISLLVPMQWHTTMTPSSSTATSSSPNLCFENYIVQYCSHSKCERESMCVPVASLRHIEGEGEKCRTSSQHTLLFQVEQRDGINLGEMHENCMLRIS